MSLVCDRSLACLAFPASLPSSQAHYVDIRVHLHFLLFSGSSPPDADFIQGPQALVLSCTSCFSQSAVKPQQQRQHKSVFQTIPAPCCELSDNNWRRWPTTVHVFTFLSHSLHFPPQFGQQRLIERASKRATAKQNSSAEMWRRVMGEGKAKRNERRPSKANCLPIA